MNVFKSLGKLIWGDSSNPELVQISSGQFYVYKSSAARSQTRECIYIDSMATIRRTTQPYQYVLAINRVFEEGEETLEDEEQELDDEKVFLIDQAMKFRKGVSAGATAFTWQGLSADDAGLEYEFVCDDETTVFTANNFEITTYHCMYERKYQKTHFSAEEEAVEEFQLPPTPSRSSTAASPGATSPRTRKTSPVPKTESLAPVKKEEDIDRPAQRDAPTKYDGVAEATGQLNLFDPKTNLFMLQAEHIRCQLLRTEKFKYWLVVLSKDGKQQLAQPVEARMNPVFSASHLSFIWNYFDEQQNVYSWLIRFPNEAALSEFQAVFGECMYESLNMLSWDKVPTTDQEYMIKTFQDDVEMSQSDKEEDEEEEEEEEEDEEELFSDEGEGSYDEDEDEHEESPHETFKQDTAKNSQLAVGFKDRSYVVRGDKIGVFKHNERDGLDFATTIKNIKNKAGRDVNPSRVVLHQQDSAMVMMDPRDLDTAYKMDLEYGKIVEEWHMPGTSGVLNLVGDSKYSNLTDNKTMVGHSQNAMFRIDPRLSGNKIVDSAFKQYAKGNDFTSIATTDNGSVAVAGGKGEIKLLNTIGKAAKTALPGLGDPIIGLDVTADGRWVIATCKTYLLLIDVLNPENKKLGFDASFPAKNKPKAIKLHLKPEHVAAMRQAVSFTTARFNTGVNEAEKTIVTSTGPYVITWNFRRVKNGHYEYQIKQYADNVVADNFKFGQDRSIVVALPHDVTAVAKRNLSSFSDAFKAKQEKK
ncbi:MAG: cytoplasm protein [Linnemannia elongata]|nr:MAG: cytoplasm protein [Linnemannia elongata]